MMRPINRTQKRVCAMILDQLQTWDFFTRANSTLRGRIDVLSPSEFLTDSPSSGAIFFVIARPLVHDGRSVLIPHCIFMVQPCDSLLNGRKCAESSSPRKIKGDCPLI